MQVRYNHAMRINLARTAIGLVILWNLQAAFGFLFWPAHYIESYELQGIAGQAALRGIGLLFVMWNVPYLVAFWHPMRNRVSLFEALAMQTIGLAGEGLIFLTLPVVLGALRASILRFILFDTLGLILLICAALLTRGSQPSSEN
jgi:hypothetical protein